MKGIYVIAIAFLASCGVNATNSDQEQPVQPISEEDSQRLNIYTVCPFPEPWNGYNITTNLPHEWDCTKFYKCFLGKGILQECPLMIKNDPSTRLHYNRHLQVCDWPWQAGCQSCYVNKYADGTYPPAFKINDRLNNRYDCNYRECSNGVELPGGVRQCPGGTCFSRTCQACVPYRDGGICSGGSTPPWTPPTTTTSGVCRNGDTKNHDCDCGKYYLCYYEDWIVYECPPGLHYGSAQKQCLAPNDAKCLIPQ